MSSNGGLHDSAASADEHPNNEPPTLPPIPPADELDCAFSTDCPTPVSLLTIPAEIRQLIFDAIIPLGPLITLRIHSHTTHLKHLYALSQTCRALHSEITTTYLNTRPLTIFCSQSLSPNIMNGIPPCVLARVETLAIEDSPATEPNWALLRNISTICFTDIYDLLIHPTIATTSSGPSSTTAPIPLQPVLPSSPTSPSTQQPPQTIILTYPPTPTSLPSNNTILAHAHRYWQSLRLDHAWIRQLWKRGAAPYDAMPHVRVLLRRVFEAKVDGLEGLVVAWHGVVDVDSRKVVENRYLETRLEGMGKGKGAREAGVDAEYVFPYGAQTWWRRGVAAKGQEV